MPRDELRSVGRARRRVLWAIAAVVFPFVALPAIALGIFVVVVASGGLEFGPAPRKHLEPIEISARACPYVELMHAAANNFQAAAPVFGMAVDEHGNALSWPETRARLDPTLAALDDAIQASSPHFPPEIQWQLGITATAVRDGRAQLVVARDGFDLVGRTRPAFDRGKEAFGFASDLVGHQCRVPLGADDSARPYDLRQSD